MLWGQGTTSHPHLSSWELGDLGLGSAPALCARSGLKVPIVWWYSLCQGHETEAIPAVSRQRPLGLSLVWDILVWTSSLTKMGVWRRPTYWTGSSVHILPLRLLGYLLNNLLGASPCWTPGHSVSLPLLSIDWYADSMIDSRGVPSIWLPMRVSLPLFNLVSTEQATGEEASGRELAFSQSLLCSALPLLFL